MFEKPSSFLKNVFFFTFLFQILHAIQPQTNYNFLLMVIYCTCTSYYFGAGVYRHTTSKCTHTLTTGCSFHSEKCQRRTRCIVDARNNNETTNRAVHTFLDCAIYVPSGPSLAAGSNSKTHNPIA